MTFKTKIGLIYGFGLTMAAVAIFYQYKLAHLSTTDPCRQARADGWEAGALAVVNYDRRVEGLPAFKTWAEFEAYAKESRTRMAGLQMFFDQIDKDRAESKALRDRHPVWVIDVSKDHKPPRKVLEP